MGISVLVGETRPYSSMHIRQNQRIGRERRGLRSAFAANAEYQGFAFFPRLLSLGGTALGQ